MSNLVVELIENDPILSKLENSVVVVNLEGSKWARHSRPTHSI